MKKYKTVWMSCSGCGEEVERDARLKGQIVTCFDCKRKRTSEYKKEYDQHISVLLKKFPFRKKI